MDSEYSPRDSVWKRHGGSWDGIGIPAAIIRSFSSLQARPRDGSHCSLGLTGISAMDKKAGRLMLT